MSEHNSPYFTAGEVDGAADEARPPPERTGFDPEKAWSWMYRKGFARGFLAARNARQATDA